MGVEKAKFDTIPSTSKWPNILTCPKSYHYILFSINKVNKLLLIELCKHFERVCILNYVLVLYVLFDCFLDLDQY